MNNHTQPLFWRNIVPVPDVFYGIIYEVIRICRAMQLIHRHYNQRRHLCQGNAKHSHSFSRVLIKNMELLGLNTHTL